MVRSHRCALLRAGDSSFAGLWTIVRKSALKPRSNVAPTCLLLSPN